VGGFVSLKEKGEFSERDATHQPPVIMGQFMDLLLE